MNLLESKSTKVLRDTMAMLTNMAKSVNLHKKQITLNSGTLKLVMTKLSQYMEQYQDKEFMATLSLPEKQALMQNAQNINKVMTDLQNEIDYLDMAKHTHFVSMSIKYLEEAYMVLNIIFEDLQGDSGEIAYAKLACIKPKLFEGSEYNTQIKNLEAELDVLMVDLGDDLKELYTTGYDLVDLFNPLVAFQFQSAYTSLTLAWKWLCLEIDRDKKSDTQAYKKIEIPGEVKPEIPKAPDDKPTEEVEG